jgi:phage FluMu gp28-like protein
MRTLLTIWLLMANITIADPPALKPEKKLRLSQKRFVLDEARYCFFVAGVQTGKSHAASFKHVRKRLRGPQDGLSVVLSASERQSKELAEKAKMHLRDADAILQSNLFEGTSIAQHEIRIGRNRSRLIFLPANPDTVRGYTGDVLLDEFALHKNAPEIFAAMMTRATLGYSVDMMSTFKGKNNKFYEIAKLLGLHTGEAPAQTPVRVPGVSWSGHWCSTLQAIEEGLKIDFKEIREAILDEAIISQEYLCIPMASGEEFIPLELVLHCESEEASLDFDFVKRPNLFAGMDIGRKRDRTVITIVEKVQRLIMSPGVYVERVASFDDAAIARGERFEELMRRAQEAVLAEQAQTKALAVKVQAPFGLEDDELFVMRGMIVLDNQPFTEQQKIASAVAGCVEHMCIDAGGIGANLAENLHNDFPAVVEPVTFDLNNKEYMAVNSKLCMERGRFLIPECASLRLEFPSLKRFVTATGRIRFDAARTDTGHADRVWGTFLALNAAAGMNDYVPASECAVHAATQLGNLRVRKF